MDDLKIEKLAYFKRRFQDTYNYVVKSVKRGSAYPVPVCFIKTTDIDGERHILLPFVFNDTVAEFSDGALLRWLLSFDIAPFERYEEMFVEAEIERIGYSIGKDVYNFIIDIGEITEELRDLHAMNKELHDSTIARNDVTTDASKEFAGTFMDGGETSENVQRAQTILAHMKTLGQTKIARYLGGCDGICINNGAELHRWLKNNGFAVGRYQGFIRVYGEAVNQREKEQKLRDKVVKVEISKTNN